MPTHEAFALDGPHAPEGAAAAAAAVAELARYLTRAFRRAPVTRSLAGQFLAVSVMRSGS